MRTVLSERSLVLTGTYEWTMTVSGDFDGAREQTKAADDKLSIICMCLWLSHRVYALQYF